jgi:hypothetical protein
MVMCLIGLDDRVLEVPGIGPADGGGETQVVCLDGPGMVFDEEAVGNLFG